MAEAIPKKRVYEYCFFVNGLSIQEPPFLRLESSTIPNSFGKVDTKGLLDINFFTGMSHILGFRRYKSLDSFVECSSFALRISKASMLHSARWK